MVSTLLRKEVWATFPRQDEAINFEKRHENVRIFSYQDHFSGQRRFLVSTYEEFWKRFLFLPSLTFLEYCKPGPHLSSALFILIFYLRYKSMDPRHRHHYEVIQEVSRSHSLMLP